MKKANYLILTVMLMLIILISCKKKYSANFLDDCCNQGEYVTQIIESDTLYINSYFTPQGDGYREFFQVFINNIKNTNHPPIKVKVKNVWGTALQSDDYKSDWDGKNKKEGKYKFEVTYKDVTVIGNVCLLRSDLKNCPESCENCSDPIIQQCFK